MEGLEFIKYSVRNINFKLKDENCVMLSMNVYIYTLSKFFIIFFIDSLFFI